MEEKREELFSICQYRCISISITNKLNKLNILPDISPDHSVIICMLDTANESVQTPINIPYGLKYKRQVTQDFFGHKCSNAIVLYLFIYAIHETVERTEITVNT